ncbi:gp53-like domain-containing protein [Mixta intestinalis]|uniref:gp53-like domain-containing protein n=1 Tax=Mixta intestinalis TaxID=1615494 RepID=UPI001AD73B9D|nr:hypothetical protein [Mixta intestinalis]
MSFFKANLTRTGWQKLPGGLIIQWGLAAIPAQVTTGTVQFPIPYPKDVFAIFITDTGAASISYGTTERNNSGFKVTRSENIKAGNINGFYLSIGM